VRWFVFSPKCSGIPHNQLFVSNASEAPRVLKSYVWKNAVAMHEAHATSTEVMRTPGRHGQLNSFQHDLNLTWNTQV